MEGASRRRSTRRLHRVDRRRIELPGTFTYDAAAEFSIGEYIENFYNPERLHSHLDYVTPIEFEMKTAMVETAA